LPTLAQVKSLAWHPEGKRLAAACASDGSGQFPVYVWDAVVHREPLVLRGHSAEVVHVAFNHGGDLLVSSSWDGTTRLWDPWTGRQLVNVQVGGARVQFRPDDQVLGYPDSGGFIGLWEVTAGRECRTLYANMGYKESTSVDYSPDGRLLASAGSGGVRLWDVAAAKEVAFLSVGWRHFALFHPSGQSLITCGRADLHRWPIDPGPELPAGGLRVGPPQSLARLAPSEHNSACLSPEGRTLVVTDHDRGQILAFDLANQARQALPGGHQRASLVTISPDGRWVASGTYAGKGVRIWNLHTLELARELPDAESVTFSPDSQWLVTGTERGHSFWEAGSWQPGREIRDGGWYRAVAFSRDGKLLALDSRVRGSVRLLDPGTAQEIATLTAPDPAGITWLCFSPDGSQLAVAAENNLIHLWDLRRIRRQLVELNLDWDLPPYPPAKASESPKPLRVTVAGGA
jgi:WD40 repeat protein